MENELFMDDFYAVSRVGHPLNPWICIPSSAAIPRNRRAMLGSAARKRPAKRKDRLEPRGWQKESSLGDAVPTMDPYIHWIGLRENLQESPICHGKNHGFL